MSSSSEITGEQITRLLERLQSHDRFQVLDAIKELGRGKVLAAVTALIGILEQWREREPEAQAAAMALGEIGDLRAVEPLLAVMKKFSGVAEILVKLHDERALDPLICWFRDSPNPSIATMLGRWGDSRALEPLMHGLQDSDQHVRYYSARALGNLGDPRAIPLLELSVQNDTSFFADTWPLRNKSVSIAAAKAIVSIRSRQFEQGRSSGSAVDDSGGLAKSAGID